MARREGAYGRNAGILRRTLGRGTGLRAGDDWREGRSWRRLKTSLNPAGELDTPPPDTLSRQLRAKTQQPSN